MIWIDIDRCIIYYDSISTKNTLREVTVTTLSTLQNCKAIRENFWGDNLHHEQGNGIPEDLTSSIIMIQSVPKNMFMLRH